MSLSPKKLRRPTKVDDYDGGEQYSSEIDAAERVEPFVKEPDHLRKINFTVPLNAVSLKLFGSPREIQLERERLQRAGKWIIHPFSNFRFVWDCITVFLLMMNLIMIPFGIAYFKGDELLWLVFKLSSDTWFLMDIIFNFQTGICSDDLDGKAILDLQQIRRSYLKGWFMIDFISTCPFDVFFSFNTGAPEISDASAERTSSNKQNAILLLRLTKLLALVRILRLSRFIRYIRQWQEVFLNYQFESLFALVRVINLIAMILFVCHFNGCLQYMVPMFYDFPETSWVYKRGMQYENVTIWEKYSRSVFRSTSQMLSTGYGEDVPSDLVDLWVAYWSMISGGLSFALFIGHATSLIQSMDASKRIYKEKYMQVKEYMSFRKLPIPLRSRVADYYEYRFQGKMFDEDKILLELNDILRIEIIRFTCQELVNQVPFFRDADTVLMNEVLIKLQFEVFLKDDQIFKEGQAAKKMYFINRGSVRIYSRRQGVEQILQEGCYFGEIALSRENAVLTGTATAKTCCFLYTLSAEDFNNVMNNFPKQNTKLSKLKLKGQTDKHFTTRSSSHILNRRTKLNITNNNLY